MPRVKTFRAAILVIASVAFSWVFYCSRLKWSEGIGSKTGAEKAFAKQEHGQSPPVSTESAPSAKLTPELPSAVPTARPGKILAIPGLPPLSLENATDLAWKKKIDAVVNRTDLSDTMKAKSLLEMLPSLPEQAIAEAAQEAAARLPDADYREVIRSTLLDPKTDNRVMAVLFADLMERPAALSLPILLSIAKDSRHPYAPTAQQNLGQALGQNLGTDWAKWEEAIQNHVAILRK